MAAAGLGDIEWQNWVYLQIEAATNELKDGQMFEEKLAIFSKVIESYFDSGVGRLAVNEPLPLKSVTDKIQGDGLRYISPQVVKKTLINMGLKVQL